MFDKIFFSNKLDLFWTTSVLLQYQFVNYAKKVLQTESRQKKLHKCDYVKNNKREGKKVCGANSINNYPPVKVFYTGEAYTKLPIELYESASLAVMPWLPWATQHE
jgi:hypothetical protein